MVKKSPNVTSPKKDLSKKPFSDRNLRSFAKGLHKNFRELANGKWECKICRKYYNDSGHHLSQYHDLTLAEYEHTAGVTTYMNQFAQEVEETVVQVMDIDMEEPVVQMEGEPGTEQVQGLVAEIYAPVTEEVKVQVHKEVRERNMGNINEASSVNEHQPGTEPISHNGEEPGTEQAQELVAEIYAPVTEEVQERNMGNIKGTSSETVHQPGTEPISHNVKEPVSEEVEDPLSSPQPMEERKDFVALQMPLSTFASTHENPNQGATNSAEGAWECKICKKRLKFAAPQSHLLHYHKMTYAKYIRDFVKHDTGRAGRGEPDPVPQQQHPSYIDMVKEAITAVRARNKVGVFIAQFMSFPF